MSKWPNPQDYREAIQHPLVCFSDEELRSGEIELDGLQLPAVQCGQFAAVFKINSGANSWAVRCFLHNFADCKERYRRVSDFLQADPMQQFVESQILEQGIRIDDDWFPVLKMRFVAGATFGEYIRRNLNDQQALSDLLVEFENMLLTLKAKGIAHGDLQHDNILVSDGRLLLVDYDGLYIPSLENLPNHELGHPNYQHPARRQKHFGAYLDNFAGWLIKSGLEYLIQDTHNLEELDNDSLLVRHNDLLSPHTSKNLLRLEMEGGVARTFSRRIRTLIQMPVEQVPYINQYFDIDGKLPEIIPAADKATMPVGMDEGVRKNMNSSTMERVMEVDMGAIAIRVKPKQEFPCKFEMETGKYCHRCATKNQPGCETQEGKIALFLTRILGLAIMYMVMYTAYSHLCGFGTIRDFSWNLVAALFWATMETVFGGFTILSIVVMSGVFFDARCLGMVIFPLFNLFVYKQWDWCPYAYVPVRQLFQSDWWLSVAERT